MLSANIALTSAGILISSKRLTEEVSLCLKSDRLVNTVNYWPGYTVKY